MLGVPLINDVNPFPPAPAVSVEDAPPAAPAPPPPDPLFGELDVPPSLPCGGLTEGVFPDPPAKLGYPPPPPEPPDPPAPGDGLGL